MNGVSTVVWFSEGDLPTGYVNPGDGDMGSFPIIRLLGRDVSVTLQGYTGDFVPYLRKLAELCTELADELDAAPAMAGEAPVCAYCPLPAGHTGDHAPAVES